MQYKRIFWFPVHMCILNVNFKDIAQFEEKFTSNLWLNPANFIFLVLLLKMAPGISKRRYTRWDTQSKWLREDTWYASSRNITRTYSRLSLESPAWGNPFQEENLSQQLDIGLTQILVGCLKVWPVSYHVLGAEMSEEIMQTWNVFH